MAEAKDLKIVLYIACLDVKKAFDVIRHLNLLDRLYQLGLADVWWKLKHSAYTNLREHVKWKRCSRRSCSRVSAKKISQQNPN